MEGVELGSDMVTEVVARIRPELRQLLWRYGIPVASMVDVLARALVAAADTWEEGADREDWVLAAVELECSAFRRGATGDRRQGSRCADRRQGARCAEGRRGRLPPAGRAVWRPAPRLVEPPGRGDRAR